MTKGTSEFAREACAANGFAPEQVTLHHGVAAGSSGIALFPVRTSRRAMGARACIRRTDDERAAAVTSGKFDELPTISLETSSEVARGSTSLHLDIQGGEADLVESCGPLLDAHAPTLVIGTHSREIEGRLFRGLLGRHWRLEIERPAILDLSREAPTTVVDGVQGWRNLSLTPE